MITWLDEFLPHTFMSCEVSNTTEATIFVYEINHLFDWVKVNRLCKHYPKSIVIPIVAEHLTYSSPIAIDLKLQALLMKPINKTKFLRTAKKLYSSYTHQQALSVTFEELSHQSSTSQNSPFQDAFLWRLIRGEIKDQQEIIQASSFISKEYIPNIVLLIQGYHIDQNHEIAIDASSIVIRIIREQFATKTSLSFLNFEKYLLLLMRIPTDFTSFKNWREGVDSLLKVIEILKNEYHIHLFIGVGGVFQDTMKVNKSYSQARKARKKPPVDNIHIRFYEDLTKNEQLQKAVSYIEEHCHEPIILGDVAKHINFSPAHFGRLFKKETGCKFVDYVALTRIIITLPFLRRQDCTVEQISANTGFNTPNYYSLTFKKYVGISPSDYRNTKEILFR